MSLACLNLDNIFTLASCHVAWACFYIPSAGATLSHYIPAKLKPPPFVCISHSRTLHKLFLLFASHWFPHFVEIC